MVAIDEAHLYTMHGRTFRECIRVLRDVFFETIFADGEWHPLFLVMTATMTLDLVESLSILTCVEWGKTIQTSNWPRAVHQMWSSAWDFRQRYIDMTFSVTGDIGQVAIPSLVCHLKRNNDSYACLFVNFKSECSVWSKKLEEQLAAAGMTIDVLQITGDMEKEEKFAFIRLFTSDLSLLDFNPRVLAATAAANTGIDQEQLDFVVRVGLPRCIITALQERGRNARVAGMIGCFAVFTSWTLFVKLILTTLVPIVGVDAEANEFLGTNSMITSRSPEKRKLRQRTIPATSKRPLSSSEKRDNIIGAYNDIIDVLHLYFLPGFGCIHCRCEWFMSTGQLECYPEVMLPCETQCFVCKRDPKGYIKPILFRGAVDFLGSKRIQDAMPLEITYASCDDILDLLYMDRACSC